VLDGPAPGAPQLRPRGSNQVGLRQYNERVVLQAIRLHGELPKADLARLTRLSTQTVSLIVNHLLDDGLLLKREPLRGRIGQPSVPIALNPAVRGRSSLRYDYPDPLSLFDELQHRLAGTLQQLGPGAGRVAGVGVAAPLSLGGWQALLGVPAQQAQGWDGIDLEQRLRAMTDLPVHVIKDTAAACVAELVAGRGRSVKNFLYLFMDTFIGGGLVLGSQLHGGAHGNAGAVASMPMHVAQAGGGDMPPQILSAASLLGLQRQYQAAGLDPEAAADARALEPPWSPHTRAWLKTAAQAMAFCIVQGACLLDLEQVIVDGVFARDLLSRLMAELENALDHHSWEGVHRPSLLAGTIGADARALGGALLPLYAQFAPDPEVFLK
jgi:predicted NBD/HSP70 family sugar kinase